MSSDLSQIVKLLGVRIFCLFECQNHDYIIREQIEETEMSVTDFSDMNPVEFLFSLLRDNMLSLEGVGEEWRCDARRD